MIDFSIYVSDTRDNSKHAVRCADRILTVADTCHPAIRDQAVAFKQQIAALVKEYMDLAARSERGRIIHALDSIGQVQIAEHVRNL